MRNRPSFLADGTMTYSQTDALKTDAFTPVLLVETDRYWYGFFPSPRPSAHHNTSAFASKEARTSPQGPLLLVPKLLST